MIAFPPITASSSTLADILEELHDEVYVYDALSLRMVYANKTARLRCGWDGAALGTKRIYDSSDMFDTPGFHRHVEPLRQGLTDAVTIEALHEKGLVEITTRLLPAWNGVPVFISVLRDREHRRQLERARSQAFSEIVHDLRTPLTSIMGALKLMESGALGDLPPQAQNLLGLVQRNADTLLSIVGDILDLQKFATNGRDSLEDMEHLDLVALTKEAVSAHLGYCAVHNVSVRMTAAPDLAWVNGVPLRLHQMLANLLSNAIKNSPAHETVEVELCQQGEAWQIRISNAGPGIPEHLRARIFDNYVQAAAPQKTKVKGTGLGLAICKKIIKSHSGQIDFSCDTDGRTVFFVDIPKQEPPSGHPQQ